MQASRSKATASSFVAEAQAERRRGAKLWTKVKVLARLDCGSGIGAGKAAEEPADDILRYCPKKPLCRLAKAPENDLQI